MSARRFLDRFRVLGREGSPLALFADDLEGYAAAVRDAPDELIEAAEEIAAQTGHVADLVPGSFASAACDAQGLMVVADPAFLQWLGRDDLLEPVIARVRNGEPHLSTVIDDHSGRPVALATGDNRVVASWPTSAEVRGALGDGRARYAVIAFRPDRDGWQRAGQAIGLTASETRLVAALARTGNLKLAAASLGVAYETARKLVGAAMEKGGVNRQTDLVRRAMQLAAGDLRTPAHTDRLLAELFDLNIRSALIARQIALGGSRGQVAKALGISEHAVKSGLKDIYLACGVESAVDLARLISEVDALAGLASACDIELNIGQVHDEPLRMIQRRWTEGRIALIDHGPASGFPVVIYQVNTMSRAISARFVAELQQAGLRPIIFDRSGFGLTDYVEGNPYEVTARDTIDVLDLLECTHAVILSRGFAAAAVTAAKLFPDRIPGGVLLGPDVPVGRDRNKSGFMGIGRAIFYENRKLARSVVKLLAYRTSSASIARMMRESVAGSAVDQAALDDPTEMATIVRSNRQASLGIDGFLAETLAQANGGQAPPLADGRGWTIAYGIDDPLYRFGDGEEYWRETLPGVKVVPVAGGGRFLHLTHGAEVARLTAEVISRTRG